MGKGDRKTKKGKIAMGSYGVTRPKKGSLISDSKSTKKSTPKAKAKPKAKPKAKKAD